MVRKIFFYTVSVHHRPTSSSSSSSTLIFAPASSFALLCAARRHISPHHRLILYRFRPECRRPTFLPPATSITPVDARTSFILFETDVTGLLIIYVIQRHHLHFYTPVDHSPRLCAELRITINTNLQIYSICTLMGRVLCVLRLLGRQGPPRGVSSRGTYYWGTYLSSCCSLLPM